MALLIALNSVLIYRLARNPEVERLTDCFVSNAVSMRAELQGGGRHAARGPAAVRVVLPGGEAELGVGGDWAGDGAGFGLRLLPDAWSARHRRARGLRAGILTGAREGFQRGSLANLFFRTDPIGLRATILVWIAVTPFAWLSRSRLPRFCWCWIVLTPLPIEFLVERYQGCLYIPMVGWAVLGRVAALLPGRSVVFAVGAAAVLAVAVINPVARQQGRLQGEVLRELLAPTGRARGRRAVRNLARRHRFSM